MKRLKAMTNEEWAHKHYPKKMKIVFDGGIACCPNDYDLQNFFCGKNTVGQGCGNCWNLPAKRNGKYIMKVIKK